MFLLRLDRSDASGTGFAAVTFGCGCSPARGCSTGSAVVLTPVSMGGAKVEGSLSEMAGSILPPPPQLEAVKTDDLGAGIHAAPNCKSTVRIKSDDEPDLTPKMMKTMVKEWINNFDMDRDGFWDRNEVSLWMTNERGGPPLVDIHHAHHVGGPPLVAMMSMIDTDGDTLCSKAELEEFAQRMKDMDSTWTGMKKKATKDEL